MDELQQHHPLVCESARLRVRRMRLDDADFVLRQLTQPSWLRYIGDRGVASVADAKRYIETRTFGQYSALGYGMYVVESRASGEPVGVCGLVKREYLPDPDLGFALLEEHWGQGYATEAAAAVVEHERQALGITRLFAITTATNERSGQVLGRLGFRLDDDAFRTPTGERLRLYSIEFKP